MELVNEQLLKSISGSHQMISDELSRPKEDVVGISVCGSTKRTIADVLRLYLSSRNIAAHQGQSPDELMVICISQNEKFNQFDMSALSCKCEVAHNSQSYCLGEEKMYSCFKLLNSIKDFVYEELKINETNFLD